MTNPSLLLKEQDNERNWLYFRFIQTVEGKPRWIESRAGTVPVFNTKLLYKDHYEVKPISWSKREEILDELAA
jgi:hypothetical protein